MEEGDEVLAVLEGLVARYPRERGGLLVWAFLDEEGRWTLALFRGGGPFGAGLGLRPRGGRGGPVAALLKLTLIYVAAAQVGLLLLLAYLALSRRGPLPEGLRGPPAPGLPLRSSGGRSGPGLEVGMRREDHFRPFSSWLSDLEREVACRTQAVPLFSGITAQGWPYCPGVGRLSASFRVPGGAGVVGRAEGAGLLDVAALEAGGVMEPKDALTILTQAALEGAAGGEILRVYQAQETLAEALRLLEERRRALEALEARHRALEARFRQLDEARGRALLLLLEAHSLLRRQA